MNAAEIISIEYGIFNRSIKISELIDYMENGKESWTMKKLMVAMKMLLDFHCQDLLWN